MGKSGIGGGYYAEIAPALNGWYNVYLYRDGEFVGVQVSSSEEHARFVQSEWETHKRGLYT